MLNAATLRHKYHLLPDPITVTLGPRNATSANVTVNNARRRPLNRDEIALFGPGGFDPQHRAWLLPVAELSGAVPKNGDLLTDSDSTVYVLKSVALELQDTIYRVVGMEGASNT